jgi:hypothetical protein
MTVDTVFQLLKYRASKSGYAGVISSKDFNLVINSAQIRYFNKLFGNQNEYRYGDPVPRIAYPGTLKVSTSLGKFKSTPTALTIDNTGHAPKPSDIYYIDSISHVVTGGTLPTPIKRVEEQDLADNLFSYYEMPTELFPIYVEYPTYIQFYPITLATASLNYLKAPTAILWASTLNGGIASTNTLVGGSGYTNGVYANVNFTGGTGNSAMGTITVVGGIVTSVSVSNAGFGYKVGDTLSASIAGGTGFSVKVASISNAREVYDSVNSVDPQWQPTDIDEIVYMALSDIGINLKDNETEQFANANMKSGGIG